MNLHLLVRVFAVLVLPLSFLGACATMPSSPSAEVEITQKEMEIGEAAFAKLAGTYHLLRDEEETKYLTKMLRGLAVYSSRQELTYYAGILDTDEFNAYSLPGGYVLVTKGILKAVKEPGALAGVLAHELGHINLRHILKNVNIQVGMGPAETLARLLAGSRQVVTGAVDQINSKIEERLFMEGFSSDDEYRADAYAVALLESIGYSASSYRDLLDNLGTGTTGAKTGDLDRTHPPLGERTKRIDSLMTPGLPSLEANEAFESFRARVAGL